MTLNRKTAVIGAAIMTPIEDQSRSLEELLYDATQAALRDAGISIYAIDGIVVASNDQFDGRAISIMAASGSVGGVDRDILSTPSAGEHAFVMGVLRIASGQYETQLIVSWSPTEASSLSEAQRLGADPYYHRALPLDELSAFALQASAIGARTPDAHALAAQLAAHNRQNGKAAYSASTQDASEIDNSPPLRWPIRRDMVSVPVTGVVAVVLASEDYVVKKGIANPAWIRGMGWATESGYLGDRDLSRAPALEAAARRAFEESGIDAPLRSLDVVELTDSTPYQQLLICETLGLSGPSTWREDFESGRFAVGGTLPINPSGGVASFNPVFCIGLIRIAEAANQVRGKAGRHQVEKARTALAHAASGFAMMYQTVLVFSAEPEGATA